MVFFFFFFFLRYWIKILIFDVLTGEVFSGWGFDSGIAVDYQGIS